MTMFWRYWLKNTAGVIWRRVRGAACTCGQQTKDKANEPIRVWHLVISMGVAAWFMSHQFSTAMREVYTIRVEVEEQQKLQTDMIIGGLELLGVPIKDLIQDSLADQKEAVRAGR